MIRCSTCGRTVPTVRETRGRDRVPGTYMQAHGCTPFAGCDIAAPVHRLTDGTLCPSPRHTGHKELLDTTDEA